MCKQKLKITSFFTTAYLKTEVLFWNVSNNTTSQKTYFKSTCLNNLSIPEMVSSLGKDTLSFIL